MAQSPHLKIVLTTQESAKRYEGRPSGVRPTRYTPEPLSVRERLDWTLRWQLHTLARAPLTPELERVMNAELRRAR